MTPGRSDGIMRDAEAAVGHSKAASRKLAAAERSARYRYRLKAGYRSIQVEVGRDDARTLAALGYLDLRHHDDPYELTEAIHRLLDGLPSRVAGWLRNA
jgi:hypothetical protein